MLESPLPENLATLDVMFFKNNTFIIMPKIETGMSVSSLHSSHF